MSDDFNIRPYIRVAFGHWGWIAGTGIIAMIVVNILLAFLPKRYEATSLVAITEPRQIIQFDPRIDSTGEQQPLEAFPELATSDAVFNLVLEQATQIDNSIKTIRDLDRIVDAERGSGNRIIRMAVRHEDPITSAALANIWAETFVVWSNELFGVQGESQLLFFQEQLAEAKAELVQANQALADFQSGNRAELLENELQLRQDEQAAYLTRLAGLSLLKIEIESFRDQHEGGEMTQAEQLTLLLLHIQVYADLSETELQLPLVLDETDVPLSSADLSADLEALLNALEAQKEGLNASLEAIEPEYLELQTQLQELTAAGNALNNDVIVAEEVVLAISRKVDEEEITTQDKTSGLQLASIANEPVEPAGPSRVLVTLAAAVLGAALSTIAVLGLYWWQEPAE